MNIGLITVSFNSEKTIRDTLESVSKQSVRPNEYVIIDGSSTDRTLKIIEEYGHVVTKVISEPDNGIYDAMNKGISNINSDIVALLNSDDTYTDDNVLKDVLTGFKSGYKVVCGGVNYINFDRSINRRWILKKYPGTFKYGWHPPHPSFFASKELYSNLGNFNLDYPIAADFDLMFRFIEVDKNLPYLINRALVNMKLGGESNKSFKNIFKGNAEIRKSLSKGGLNVNYMYSLRRLFFKYLQKFKCQRKY